MENNHQLPFDFALLIDSLEKTTLGEFLAANSGPEVTPLDDDDIAALKALRPGKHHYLNYGCSGITLIERI